jgi:hypothetical protein
MWIEAFIFRFLDVFFFFTLEILLDAAVDAEASAVFPLSLEITMRIAIDEQEDSLAFQPISCVK